MLVVPRQPKDVDDLSHPSDSRLRVDVECPELLVTPADTEPRDDAAPRELIDDGEVFGKADRVVEGGQDNAGAELDALGHRGESGQHHGSDGR